MSVTVADEGQHDDQGRELLIGSRPPASPEWESVVSELYAAHYRSLVRYARFSMDPQTAEDAVQQSFLEFLARRPILESPGRELAYLRVMVHHAGMRLRQGHAYPMPDVEVALGARGALASAEREVMMNSTASDVASVLRELPLRQRETLALAIEGLQPSEIARVLGIEPNAVRVSLHHARVKVQARLVADSAAKAA